MSRPNQDTVFTRAPMTMVDLDGVVDRLAKGALIIDEIDSVERALNDLPLARRAILIALLSAAREGAR